jgi:hypothetical protein
MKDQHLFTLVIRSIGVSFGGLPNLHIKHIQDGSWNRTGRYLTEAGPPLEGCLLRAPQRYTDTKTDRGYHALIPAKN